MGRFYETTFYDKGKAFIGWQALASPALIGGIRPDYSQLLDNLENVEIDREDRQLLYTLFGLIGDPTSYMSQGEATTINVSNLVAEMPLDYIEDLLAAPYFAAELSPLKARTIVELIGTAESIHLVLIGHHPAIVLTGDALGLLVVRSLTVVGGAMWEGAREEIKELGRDIAAQHLDAIRGRLGIRRRNS